MFSGIGYWFILDQYHGAERQRVVCVLLQLDKVPLNVYGSFGHTAVIIYFCVDNYGSQLWQNVFVLYCKNTSYHVNFCSEP